jgi:Uma2 family endonuclease
LTRATRTAGSALSCGTARNGTVAVALDSNTGYILPNSAIRSPDASWISLDRLRSVPREARRGFLPLCPDFAIELMSPSDRLKRIQAKMVEYIDNGAKLGWLIDEAKGAVYIYRPARDLEKLVLPETLIGEGPVEGFVLDSHEIWAIRDSV